MSTDNLSPVSRGRLRQCHKDLQRIVSKLAETCPILVICGHRTEAEQNAAFKAGKSKLKYPHSKHNRMPARAVDLARSPLDWTDTAGFKSLGAEVKRVAGELGIKVRWGGDWDMDGDTKDEKFIDLPHFELVD